MFLLIKSKFVYINPNMYPLHVTKKKTPKNNTCISCILQYEGYININITHNLHSLATCTIFGNLGLV